MHKHTQLCTGVSGAGPLTFTWVCFLFNPCVWPPPLLWPSHSLYPFILSPLSPPFLISRMLPISRKKNQPLCWFIYSSKVQIVPTPQIWWPPNTDDSPTTWQSMTSHRTHTFWRNVFCYIYKGTEFKGCLFMHTSQNFLFFLSFFLEARSHYVALAVFQCTKNACLCCPSAEIKDTWHQSRLRKYFLKR